MDIERRLQDDWLRAAGLAPPPDDRIHAGDEMYAWSGALGLAQERRRMEYLRGGYEPLLMLRHLGATLGRPLGRMDRVLEFACGHGRCTRMLVRDIEPERLWASDIQADGVQFVQASFGVQGFLSRTSPADLDLGGPYDLIWVGSLFSHLPRGRFLEFLRVAYDALSDDGLLVFSTHGTTLLEERGREEFVFQARSESAVLDEVEYGSTFVRPGHVRALAAEVGIEHLASIECDLWNKQDVHVASRQALPVLATWTQTPFVRGSIARVQVGPDRHAWIGGWLRSPRGAAPVERVRLLFDGPGSGVAHDAQLGNVTDLTLGEAAPFHHAEWYLEGPTDGLAPGVHTVCAVAVDATGVEHAFDAALLELPPG